MATTTKSRIKKPTISYIAVADDKALEKFLNQLFERILKENS